MAKSYVGLEPLTMIRTVSGGYLNVFKDDPVPESIDPDDLKRLVEEKFLGEVAGAHESGDGGRTSVKDILKDVGDDKEKAQAALDAEQAKGDDARSTLVEKLQAVLSA